ncbi:ArsR family transcriptional regulator [Thermus sp.]|uniref:ArsR family transcriptional regulator n=1 Tax=Thermus sp. TaxID=275 RepID=UPI00307CCD2C
MRKMGLPLALGLLSACSGPGAPSLTVNLVDGLGEPLQPLAAAWRVGSGAWLALPTGQSSWVLPLPAGSGATFAVGFRCPSASPLSYVSLEAKRNEVGNALILRCPLDWHSPTAVVSGNANPSVNGTAFSARGQANVTGGSFNGLTAPQGPGWEVAVLGSLGGATYFGRSGLIPIPSSPTLTLSPALALTAVTPTGFPSRAQVHLDTGVTVDLAAWNGGSQTVPRPDPSALTPGELLEVHADLVTSLSILRLANQDPLAAPGSTVNLPVPSHTFAVVQIHTANALPTFTFTPLGSVGFSSGLNPLGYALLLAEPGARYWRHFASPGVATGPTYTFNLEQAPGFSGVVPSGGSVQLCASAFGGDQPLAGLLTSRPLPQETSTCYTLFLDRHHPGRFEVAQHFLSFTW